MFCPNCGVEDRQQVQFCRACGTDLRGARTGLIHPETTGPAITAREEIGRAVAAKIRDLDNAKQLAKVVEEVLPQVEKFLESPAERRLRRIRAGTITAGIGLGAVAFFALFATIQRDMVPMIGLGVVAFLIGLATLINGWLFSTPPSQTEDVGERDRLRDLLGGASNRHEARYLPQPGSVVENTTRNLEGEALRSARPRVTSE